MAQTQGLRYTGGGFGGWLPGVPARDLSADEVEQHGGTEGLLASGLYELAAETKQATGPASNKALTGPANDKSAVHDAPRNEAVL